MKLLLVLLLAPVISFGQPKVEKDTMYLNNGLKFYKGQELQLGSGSNSNTKDFNFIFTNPTILLPVANKLGSGWTGYKMKISGFKKAGNKTMGEKYYVILSAGQPVKYLCDIELALENKEVLAPQL